MTNIRRHLTRLRMFYINMEEKQDFIETLTRMVGNVIKDEYDVTYSTQCIHIVDARNHIIRLLDGVAADESNDIYSLSELTYINEDMQCVPNLMKITRIAEYYWRD